MHSLICVLTVAADLQSSPVPYVARKLTLCLLFLSGAWMLHSAFRAKRFHYRGGRPMPLWLGRLMSFVVGIFIILVVIYVWNR
jgi:hypothetical protein